MFRKLLQNCRNPQGFFGRLMVKNMNSGHAKVHKWGLSYLQPKEDARGLDIGCGGGSTVAKLLQMCPKGYICGIDYSEDSVVVSKKTNAAALGTRCDIRQGSVSQLPYHDDEFDIVTACETVYFWPNLPADFAEVYRVLKPGGSFLICNELCDPTKSIWSDRVEGMTIYTLPELQQQLKTCGFSTKAHTKQGEPWGCVIAQK